ncbi:MAG: hypothetical protein LPK80_08710 [Bacteroidota bacterium]|nr:hypothetical protein [Bacteroidota bacterium]MDX5427378.1 hypothetical protein [Bacteroidota bacterium]MDX5447396.1 hypothetical protein [Bacteroidota bacterium]MDX5505326.1 hypothetical protein [Bacteroidota bacterium]
MEKDRIHQRRIIFFGTVFGVLFLFPFFPLTVSPRSYWGLPFSVTYLFTLWIAFVVLFFFMRKRRS